MKSSGLFSKEILDFINDHIFITLFIAWVISSLILWLLQKAKVNILKITILAGTFALALAFAGNDLVNFIGVPIAGFDSYMLALNSGNEQMLMSQLAEPAYVNVWILIGAGLVMIVTLFFSRSAMKVAATQLNLSTQRSTVNVSGRRQRRVRWFAWHWLPTTCIRIYYPKNSLTR